MESTVEMFSCEGWQNASRHHHHYVLPVNVIAVPINCAHNVLNYTDARNHDLRTMLSEVMEAARIDELRYSFEGKTKIAYAQSDG